MDLPTRLVLAPGPVGRFAAVGQPPRRTVPRASRETANRMYGTFRHLLFGLSPDEASFARRGFHPGEPRARQRLELIGRTFLRGYNSALEEYRPARLEARLRAIDSEVRGFAFEGAAMALALLDCLTPWNRGRFRAFLLEAGEPHVYMAHVGLGWALARLRRDVRPALARLDPLLGWLALDGYGFHQGYFHPREHIADQQAPAGMHGYACRAFDQGLGRSLWFVDGADVDRIAAAIDSFAPARRADLWSGVGLACAYAGGAASREVDEIRLASGEYAAHAAQGAAFAAKARERAGNPAAHTELACRILCGVGAEEAARLTDEALDSLADCASAPAYETWRERMRTRLSAEVVAPCRH